METGSSAAAVAKQHQISDESLTNNLSDKYHLSIQVGEGAFAWCLLDVKQNKFVAFEVDVLANPLGLPDELKKAPWFSRLSSVSLAVVSDKFTLVPDSLYNEKDKTSYGRFNFDRHIDDELAAVKLRSAACYVVFALNKQMGQVYKNFFPAIKLLHCCMPFIESALLAGKAGEAEKVFVNIRRKSFELVVTRANALMFYNTFAYTTKEDVIYYLLFTLEQLKLNPETAMLQLCGSIEKNDALYAGIHKYVRNVGFVRRQGGADYSYRFSEVGEHAFHSLFSQHLCG